MSAHFYVEVLCEIGLYFFICEFRLIQISLTREEAIKEDSVVSSIRMRKKIMLALQAYGIIGTVILLIEALYSIKSMWTIFGIIKIVKFLIDMYIFYLFNVQWTFFHEYRESNE